jgi:hypothetical protein
MLRDAISHGDRSTVVAEKPNENGHDGTSPTA